MRWLVCFTCDLPGEQEKEAEEPFHQSADKRSYDFYPDKARYQAEFNDLMLDPNASEEALKALFRNISIRSPVQRKKVFKRFMTQKLGGLGLFVSGRHNLGQNETGKVSAMFQNSDKALGTLSAIVRPNETFAINVTNVGKVQIIRSQVEDGQDIFEKESVVQIKQQPALKSSASGEESILSTVEFTDEVTSAMEDAFQGNLSSIVAVTKFGQDGNPIHIKLDTDIKITFDMSANDMIQDPRTVKCVFWDFTQDTWSSEGCHLDSTDGQAKITCGCNHLSNFAVILGIPIDYYVEDLLRLLTLVGSSLSIIGLLAAVIFFLSLKGNERTDRIKINTHFCFNLMVVHILMIFGFEISLGSIYCKLSAIVLHFFIMSTFAWSLLAGHQIYVLLIEVFESEENKMRKYTFFGYGLPFGIILASILSDLFVEAGTYGTEEHCWLKANTVYVLYFIVPLCLILTVNLSLLVMALVKVAQIKPRPYLFGQARGWFCLVLLLGGTWALGILAKIFPNPGLTIAFVILNGLQGLMIFVFHVLLGRKCRSVIREQVSQSMTRKMSSSSQSKSDLKARGQGDGMSGMEATSVKSSSGVYSNTTNTSS